MMLVTKKGTRYEPNAADVLWLQRAVEAEGRPRDDVAATLVNGFMWARESFGTKTLADWVRSYSQPVNPRWMPGGDKYEQALATAKSDKERAKVRADAWRRQQEHSTRTTFGPKTEAAVQKALSQPPRMRGAVDFAAWWLQHPTPPWVAFGPPITGENRFWSRPGAVGWTGYEVEGVAPVPNGGGGKVLPWLGIGALTVGLLMWSQKSGEGKLP